MLLGCAKKKRRGNFLLYAKAAAVSMRTIGLEVSSFDEVRHAGCGKWIFDCGRQNKEPARRMPTGSVIGCYAIRSMRGRAHRTRRLRRQLWPTNRPEPASAASERHHVVETIGAAETCWNLVEASSRVIDRVTNYRWCKASKFDPDTGLRDSI